MTGRATGTGGKNKSEQIKFEAGQRMRKKREMPSRWQWNPIHWDPTDDSGASRPGNMGRRPASGYWMIFKALTQPPLAEADSLSSNW